ncbi:MAG: hypothetical protein ABSB58_03880 [Gemmatimonadales bacterium]
MLGALCVWAAARPSAGLLAQARPSDLTVVATQAFRPTAVLLPHFQFWIATDSGDGGALLRDLTIAPVTFTGAVHIEGAQPGARASEASPFADSVRFGGDGQVTLLLADSATGAPLAVQPMGVVGASGGRLLITAPEWPYGRLLVVTIDPADLYEHRWREVGYGVRDRIHVDDRRGIAFLSDSTIRNTVIAIGIGPGLHGGIRTDVSSMVIERRFGDAIGRERRAVGSLVLAIEPARDAEGAVRWEVDFALGTSEDDAARVLAAVAAAPPPMAGPPGPWISTPFPSVDLLLGHVLAAERPMLDYDRIAGLRHTPAGAYTFLAAFDRDGWYGATVALQLGDPGVVCSEYRLFDRFADPSGAQRHEIWNRLGPGGRYVWTDDWGGRWMGDKDAYQILKGYACYRATHDGAWLATELPSLRRIARYVLATDADGDGLVEGMSYATYSEMSPLSPHDEPYATEDPYVNALTAYALDRLAELEDAATLTAGQSPDSAATWRTAAARIRRALPALWRPAMQWFAYHATPDGTRSWDHYHLQPVDALVFDGVADTAMQAAMVRQLLRPDWWDAGGRGFFTVPATDPWHDMTSYWRGWGWHIMDFKALEVVLRFAPAPEQRIAAWRLLVAEADRILRVNYGRPGERGDDNGLFQFSAGSYLDLVARGLFGVDEHVDEVDVAPHVDGIADEFTWRLMGWRIAGDSLDVTYRPADHAATLRVAAFHRTRFVLRFPWLSANSCVEMRRGAARVERLLLVQLVDGSAYVDVRGGFEPAELRVSATACGS